MVDDRLPPPESDATLSDRLEGDGLDKSVAAAKPVGPFQRADAELIEYLRRTFREAWDGKTADVRTKRETDWKFYAGDQWEAGDLEKARKEKRPALTLNMLMSIVSAVEGEERTNRQEIKFYGEGAEDDGTAFGLNRLLKWVFDGCGGEFSLSQGFRSTLVCGEGWVVPDMDFFDDPEGTLKVLHVADDEMFDDPVSVSPTSEDSRYCHRVRYMTEEEGNARFPGMEGKQGFRDAVYSSHSLGDSISETDGAGFRDIYTDPNNQKSLKTYDAKRKLWAVTETWWFQIEPGWVTVDDQTGLLVEMSDEEFAGLKAQREAEQKAAMAQVMAGRATFGPAAPMPVDDEAIAAMPDAETGPGELMPGSALMMPTLPSIQMPKPLQAQQRPIKRFYMAFWCGGCLLDKQVSQLKDLKRIPYVPIRGLWDKVKAEWFGLIRPLLDAQRQHNTEQSSIVMMTQLMPKQAWYGPKGSFHNKTDWAAKISLPGAMLEYNKSQGKPEPIPVPPIPRHIIDMAFTRPQTMREISGVNVEMTGQRVGSDPGVVMEMRQKAARTVLAPIFDNYRMSKKALGMVLLSYMQTYISKGRRIRVLGPKGSGFVEMTEQMQIARYDVMVEETNSTINDRIATLNVLQTTLPQLAKTGVPIPPEVIDLLPMEPAIRDSWKRLMEYQMLISGQMPPPEFRPGMTMTQLQQAMLASGNAPPTQGMPPGTSPAPAPPPPPAM